MPDPTQKRFVYGQLWPLRPACSHDRAGSYLPDLTSRIRYSSVFVFVLKKAWIMLYKSDQDPIWMGLSGFDETHLVWNQAGVQESSGPVSGRPSFPLPVFHFQTRLQSSTDSPDHLVQN